MKRKFNVLALLKFIISIPYQLIHAFRELLYKLGLFKSKKLDAYVISIGNMSFGGTGKTPFTIELAKHLVQNTNLKIGILTRGYKAKRDFKTQGPVILSTKDSNENISVDDIGDEAYLMWQQLKELDSELFMVISPKRYEAGLEALEKHDIDVFILDDGMQHLQLHRDLEILLKNLNEKGYYREFPLFAEGKADYTFYTKVNSDWIEDNPTVASVEYSISLVRDLDPEKGVLAFSGLGDSPSYFELFYDFLQKTPGGEKLLKTRGFATKAYPDHHDFIADDVRELLSTGMNLVCTLKDYVKIPEDYRNQVIPVKLSVGIRPTIILDEIRGKVIDGTTNAQRNV